MLEIFSLQKLVEVFIIRVAIGPHKDVVSWLEATGNQQVGQTPWLDDGEVASVTVVDVKLVWRDARVLDAVPKVIEVYFKLQSMVDDCGTGEEVRDGG